MKKKIIIISVILIIILIGLFFFFRNRKFYLDDKFYNNGELIEIDLNKLNEVEKNKESFILFTYNSYCTLKIPCENIFKEVASNNKIDFYSIPYEEFKDSNYHNIVKFAPSVLIVKDGKIISYLDSESDKDLNKYQDTNEFSKWLDKYIYLKK